MSAELSGADDTSAFRALTAASGAPGLAPLWLAAGELGWRAGLPWAPVALARARDLDPLSPLVAFHLLTTTDQSVAAASLGEFAVTREPRLAGALWWSDHPALASQVSRQTGVSIPLSVEEDSSPPMVLALTLDREPSLSFSLFAFRRSPWPARLAPIAVHIP